MSFFSKKSVELKDISGEIARCSSYTPYDTGCHFIFSLKNDRRIFYVKDILPKFLLSQSGDKISFQIEEGETFYLNEPTPAFKVAQNSFKNHSL